MMDKSKTPFLKSVAFLAGAAALAGLAAAAHADNPVTRTIDPCSSIGNPYIRPFNKVAAPGNQVGTVQASANFMGGSITVAMTDNTIGYIYSMYHDCVGGPTFDARVRHAGSGGDELHGLGPRQRQLRCQHQRTELLSHSKPSHS